MQVLAAAASDWGMLDDTDPSLLYKAAATDSCDSIADSVTALSAVAPCLPGPSSINVLMAPPSPTAEHVSEPAQSMHRVPLYLPGTCLFDTRCITELGDVVQFEQPAASAEQPAGRLCSSCQHELKHFDTPADGWWCNACQCMLAMGMSMLGCHTCNLDYCVNCEPMDAN